MQQLEDSCFLHLKLPIYSLPLIHSFLKYSLNLTEKYFCLVSEKKQVKILKLWREENWLSFFLSTLWPSWLLLMLELELLLLKMSEHLRRRPEPAVLGWHCVSLL
ncbi:hypothetical protein Pfo_023477 [Paulownia fortunei]|nr:hypothetical protein Pfo_023477 [Paulownia fortunei]